MKRKDLKNRMLSLLMVLAVVVTTLFSNVTPVMAGESNTGNNDITATEEATGDTSGVTVYLSISDDGKFVVGNDDDETVLCRVPFTVEYFDLADYGLEDYYRYETDSTENGGGYISDTLVEQPTVLHLYIKALEEFYLDGETLEVGTDAFTCSGGPTSLFMTSFWGHDCNLMYFVDHKYPLMSTGWGSTADYILLEDGMEIDIAMFTDWSFYSYGAFANFDKTAATVAPGEEVTLTMQGVATSAVTGGAESEGIPMADEYVYCVTDLCEMEYYNIHSEEMDWEEQANSSLLKGTTDGDGQITVSFEEPGTYYLYSGDTYYTFYDELGDGTVPCVAPPYCVVTVEADEAEKEELKVSVGSIVNGTNSEFIANLTGGGTYYTGDSVTVKAPAKIGYEFMGWYAKLAGGNDYTNQTALSTADSYTFTVNANVNLVAVYKASGKVALTITEDEKVIVTDASGKVLDFTTGVKVGTQVTVTYGVTEEDRNNLLYWQNASGKVVSKNAEYTFTMVNHTTLTPVVKSTETGKAWVEFVNEYDQVLSAAMWDAADKKLALSAIIPSKLGYNCKGWALESAPKTVVDVAAVRAAITAGATHVKLLPVYEKAAIEHTVTYKNNSEGATAQTAKAELGATCTVDANDIAVAGQKFSHWAMANETGSATDEILSYNESYTFLVTGDMKLVAVFVGTEATVAKKSILEITSQYEIKNNGKVEKVAFVASREIAEGYTLLEHGMLYAKDSDITNENGLVEGVEGVNKFTANGTGKKGAFTLNVRLGETNSIKVRAYAIVKDNATGEVTTLYSGMSTYTK